MIQTSGIAKNNVGNTSFGTAAPVAPGAGATLVSVGGLTPGLYLVECWVGFAGAAAAAEQTNIRVFKSPPQTFGITIPTPAVASRNDYFSQLVQLTVETNIGLAAINNATAGVTYLCGLAVTKLV